MRFILLAFPLKGLYSHALQFTIHFTVQEACQFVAAITTKSRYYSAANGECYSPSSAICPLNQIDSRNVILSRNIKLMPFFFFDKFKIILYDAFVSN